MNKYVVAVSGGVDSMYLANLLVSKNQAAAFVHINHHTREMENEFEQQLVIDYGQENNIPVYVFDYVHNGGNFQAKAREFRYERLLEIARMYTNKIATAHHLDDQLENCMLPKHLVKSNLMEYRSELSDCYVYRPLLALDKQTIYQYAKNKNIKYNEDMSNQSLNYQRNFNRSELQNPKIKHQTKLEYILESNKQKILANSNSVIEIDRNSLIEANQAYRLLKIYQLIKSNDKDAYIKNRQLLTINQLIDLKKNSKYSVANCKELFVGYDKIYMLASVDDPILESKVKAGQNEFNGIIFETSINEGIIRTWKPGDKVKIVNGHKKVSRLFIDSKIASHQRKLWPIIVDNTGEIIEIPKIWRKNEINK